MSDASLSEDLETYQSGDFWVDIDHVSRRITVGGELDLATVPAMVDAAATLQGIIAGDITLDLEAVTFLDAATLGALVGLRVQQDAQHVKLWILGNAKVTRLADICGLSFIA